MRQNRPNERLVRQDFDQRSQCTLSETAALRVMIYRRFQLESTAKTFCAIFALFYPLMQPEARDFTVPNEDVGELMPPHVMLSAQTHRWCLRHHEGASSASQPPSHLTIFSKFFFEVFFLRKNENMQTSKFEVFFFEKKGMHHTSVVCSKLCFFGFHQM